MLQAAGLSECRAEKQKASEFPWPPGSLCIHLIAWFWDTVSWLLPQFLEPKWPAMAL